MFVIEEPLEFRHKRFTSSSQTTVSSEKYSLPMSNKGKDIVYLTHVNVSPETEYFPNPGTYIQVFLEQDDNSTDKLERLLLKEGIVSGTIESGLQNNKSVSWDGLICIPSYPCRIVVVISNYTGATQSFRLTPNGFRRKFFL